MAVVGDGFAAVEACRIAVRKGAREVTLLCHEPRQAMAAPAAEVAAAEEEGVQVRSLVAPVRVVTDAGHKLTGIEVQPTDAGAPDAEGRYRPMPAGRTSVVACDQLIYATELFPKLDGTSEEQGVKRTAARTIDVDELTLQTDDPRIFAGGDVVLGARTVVEAVAQGKKAAWSIDAFLRGLRHARGVARALAELQAKPFVAALGARQRARPAPSRAWPRSRRCSST